MKKFNYKYPVAAIIILTAVSLSSIGGIIWNIITAAGAIKNQTSPVTAVITAAINLSLAILCLWVVFGGKYIIDEKSVTLKTGPFKVCFLAEEIIKLLYFEKSKKLYLISAKKKAAAIVINPDKYDEFIAAVKRANPAVLYEIISKDELS